MAPPGGRGGRGKGRGKGREIGRGTGGGGAGKGSVDRGSQGRKRRSSRPESDPDNEHLYTNVDQFHMQKDKIAFDGGGSDSDDSDESEEEEGVMDLKGVGGDSDGDDSDEDDHSSEDDDDSDASDLPELPEHVRRAAMEASSDEGDSDEEGEGTGKFAAGWGKNRSSYYNADTADLEIGQEFEDAEAEGEAALELQKASYKGLDAADYGEEEGEDEEDDGHIADKAGRSRKEPGKGKKKATAHGAALSAMKSDLEQIALGGAGEVETSVVKRDTSKLSRRDKLELVLSEAPELPALLGEVRVQLDTLTRSVQPLVANVTADLGASKDGLVYLRTRQQLLLASCLNTCFYMILKAKGEPAKDHPVVRRLLSLRALLSDMSTLDEKMSSQMELLLRALASGVDLASAGAGDSGDEEEEGASDAAEGSAKGQRRGRVDAGEDGTGGDVRGGSSSSEEDGGGGGVDEEDLEDEEARFMGDASADGSGEEEGDKPELSTAAAKKQRRREARKKALEKAKAKAMMEGGTGDSSFGDFGDEEMDERPGTATSGRGGRGGRGGGGENILQGMVNRISQRDMAITGKRGRGLQGDLDVPIRERDQTIRVRRPVPGESEEEGEEGAGGEGHSGAESSDDFLGGGDFMGGLPPGLLAGLSGRGGGGGGAAAGEEKQGKAKKGGAGRRERGSGGGGGGGGGEGEGEEDAFYAAVAEEKERKKRAKQEKYEPKSRIAGALEAELEAEREARGETKRGASYTIIKNRGLTPHKNKLNRNPRSKKREAFRKATIRRKGQIRDIRTGEVDTYGGESTGIKSNVTRSRKLKG